MSEFFEQVIADLGSLSGNLVASLIITLFLMVMAIIIGRKIEKLDVTDKPKGLALIGVLIVSSINDFLKGFFNEKWKVFAPFLLTIFLFVAFSNISSLAGLPAPFANLSVALSFSLIAFGSIQIMAIKYHGPVGRVKGLVEPVTLKSIFSIPLALPMLILNGIGEISTPLAMGLRLFGNLISGAVIATLVYGAAQFWYFQIPASMVVLHPIFNVGFGLVQAFVFFMLFTIFLSMAVETGEEEMVTTE